MAIPTLSAIAGVFALTAGDTEIVRRPSRAPAAATPAPKPCSSPEHRQFDFWIGDWEVTQAGKIAGTNRISVILGGCALREEWKGAGGMTGTSLNMWDPGRRRWHQTWVDDKGNVLLLTGGRSGAKMILEGESPDGKGGTVKNRIGWSPLPAGHVRQLWEVSKNGGKSWETVFDGDYAPRNARGGRSSSPTGSRPTRA